MTINDCTVLRLVTDGTCVYTWFQPYVAGNGTPGGVMGTVCHRSLLRMLSVGMTGQHTSNDTTPPYSLFVGAPNCEIDCPPEAHAT